MSTDPLDTDPQGTGQAGRASGGPVHLDLTDLPVRLGTRQLRHLRVVAALLVVNGGLHGAMGLRLEGWVPVVQLVLAPVLVVVGVAMLARLRGAALLLGADGVRPHDGRRQLDLRPWSQVREVRPAGPTSPRAVLVLRGATDEHVHLVGIGPADARELQRRLAAASPPDV